MPPSSSPPRTRGPKAVRVEPDRILDAAQEVFCQAGLQAASLRSIARKAGCDPALIYYHFKNKEHLFECLLDRRFPLILREVEGLADEAAPRPIQGRLWDLLLVYHRHLKDDPGLRSLIRGEIVRGAEGLDALMGARIRPVLQAAMRLFEQGLARGELRPDLNPMLATFFLVRMELEILDLLPMVLPRLGLPVEPSPLQAVRAWFELFWRGVALDPSVPLPALPSSDALKEP